MEERAKVVVLETDSSRAAVDQFYNKLVEAVVTDGFTLSGYSDKSVQSIVHRIFLNEKLIRSIEMSKVQDCTKDIVKEIRSILELYVNINTVHVYGLRVWVKDSKGGNCCPVVIEINYGKWDSVPITVGFTEMIAERFLEIFLHPNELSEEE